MDVEMTPKHSKSKRIELIRSVDKDKEHSKVQMPNHGDMIKGRGLLLRFLIESDCSRAKLNQS